MIFTVAEYFTAFMEAVSFSILLNTFCERRDSVPRYFYYLSVIALFVLIISINHMALYTAYNVFGVILATFAVSFFYKSSISVKAIVSCLGFAIASAVEIAVMFMIAYIYNVDSKIVVQNPTLRLLGIIFSKMLAFSIVNIICMLAKRQALRLGKSYWMMFIIIFSNSSLIVYLLFKLAYEAEITEMNHLLAICSTGLFLTSFFSFYMCEHMAKQNEIINKQQQFERHLESQSKHLDDILVNQEALRKFRHDISNHLIALNGYFYNNNCDEGINYISSISKLIVDDKERIKTGNIAFDAIINTKKSLAESKGIEFCTNVQIPERLPIDAADICIIFGNALDNAIEACDRITDGKKKISLSFIYGNNSVLCKLVNTSPKNECQKSKTHKSDKINHGIGIDSIKTSLSKYGASPEIGYENGEFVLKFCVFLYTSK